MSRLTDQRINARALEQRWPISPADRAAIVEQLKAIACDPESTRREITTAIKALIAVEKQNQEDQHKLIDVHLHQQRNARLDAIAADLGIEVDTLESIAAEASGNIIST